MSYVYGDTLNDEGRCSMDMCPGCLVPERSPTSQQGYLDTRLRQQTGSLAQVKENQTMTLSGGNCISYLEGNTSFCLKGHFGLGLWGLCV